MIIGWNLVEELGIILHFNDKTATWDTDTIPMKDRGSLNSQKANTEIYFIANEPQSLIDEFSHSNKILDAEYKAAILKEVTIFVKTSMKGTMPITPSSPKYEQLFDGRLREFNMASISLNLIDQGYWQIHALPYTVPILEEQQNGGHWIPGRGLYI
jgi:hypothetical protein